jgi:hypothetical protein
MKKIRTADLLRQDTYELALPAGRLVGSNGHVDAMNWVQGRMHDIALTPYKGDSFLLPYSYDNVDFVNIVGVVKSQFPLRAPLLIGAHYDSVIASHCADDNAAAVVIALAVGEYFAKHRETLERDIVIAIFDAEEPPYFYSPSMGSERFYEDQMDRRTVHSALIMDLVGHDITIPKDIIPEKWLKFIPFSGKKENFSLPMIKDVMFMTGAESAPEMQHIVSCTKNVSGLRVINTLNSYVGDMSDHGIFRTNGKPFLFFSCGRWQHYHQSSDTPDKLNYKKMENILRYLLKLSVEISKVKFIAGTPRITDTAKLEADSLKKAFSPLTPIILKSIGLDKLETRDDLDYIASLLMSTGL